MVFSGTQDDFKVLTNSTQNYVEAVLIHAFNQGYNSALTLINSQYEQAAKAVEQNIPIYAINDGSNPFIKLLVEYNKTRDASGEMVKAND